MKRILIKALPPLLAFLVWYISLVSDLASPPWPFGINAITQGLYKLLIFPYRNEIGISLALSLAVATIISSCGTSINRKLLSTVVALQIDDLFKGSVKDYRATIFRKVSGRKALWQHIRKCLMFNFRTHLKKGLIKHYLSTIPNPSREYLVFYSRSGHPNHAFSSTKFKVPNEESEVDGIASYAMLCMKPQAVTLPRLEINSVRGCKYVHEIQDTDIRSAVQKHLDEGRVRTLQRLQSMHRIPTHIWASPILGPDEHVWGVLVMDCFISGDIFTQIPAFEERITNYVRIVERILKQDN